VWVTRCLGVYQLWLWICNYGCGRFFKTLLCSIDLWPKTLLFSCCSEWWSTLDVSQLLPIPLCSFQIIIVLHCVSIEVVFWSLCNVKPVCISCLARTSREPLELLTKEVSARYLLTPVEGLSFRFHLPTSLLLHWMGQILLNIQI